MIKKILNRLNSGSARSVIAKRNIVYSLILKGFSIFLSLLIVPITIDYVEKEQYGFWLTISSIVSWISYFDLGLGNGLRNRYAEAKAKGDNIMMSKYISTTYALMIGIFVIVFLLFALINQFINWNTFLNVTNVCNDTCSRLMIIFVGFFCLNMVFRVTNSVLLGDQKSALTSLIIVIEQCFSLAFIYALSKFTESNLLYLASVTAGVPVVVLMVTSLIVYSKRGYLHICRPSLRYIDFSLTRSLLGLGLKFFLIQLSLVLIFQTVNIIISRNCGQEMVAQYQLSHKYFNMVYMVFVIILTPYWSAFTDAFAKDDFTWMKNVYQKLNKLTLLSIPIVIIMIVLSPLFFKIWINNSIQIQIEMHICMALYIFSMIFAGVRMYILNGIGKVTLQFIIYMFFAILSIPTMSFLSMEIGVYGILLFLFMVYLTQGLFGSIQIHKLLNKKAKGVWNK